MNSLWITVFLFLFIFLILTAFLLLILIPVVIARSPYLLRKTLFTTGGASTQNSYYNEKKKELVRNFYVTFPIENGKNITLGVYHFLPLEYTYNQTEEFPIKKYDHLLKESSYHVLLLFHGRGQSRESFSAKYAILRQVFHVIVFDYRCYGDSTSAELTEEGLVNDCVYMYKWLRERTSSSIYVWGQSLGSALCIETVFILNKENITPKGMILESSFTNMREAILDSPIGRIFSWMPWFSILLDGYEKNGFLFNSMLHLEKIKCPVMIMHAVDDRVIPFHQAIKLYEVVMRRKVKINIAKFLPVAASYNCGHDFIYKFPNFTTHVIDFVNVCEMEFNVNISKSYNETL